MGMGMTARVLVTTRRFGFHPLRMGASFGQHAYRRRRSQALRTRYGAAVADPPRPAGLRTVTVELPAAAELPAELGPAAAALRTEADGLLEQRFDYLGSGPVRLEPTIDWHTDFKSGYRWPPGFYQDLEITRLDDDSDAKVPWELSRGHQLLTLARAARLFEDERYAAELERQLAGWLEANPAGVGINWVTPMEIALRAVNWTWAIGTLEAWRPLDGELRARATRSLQTHARHIALHLEGSPLLRSNHYLADVFGLLVLADALPADPLAARWRRASRRALEREIRRQVLDDGVGFEASLPYHGLALEMFLLAWHLAQRSGRPLSSAYRRRLERMLEVSRAVRHPDGRCPVFGDQDSGRVLPASFQRPPTHDNLLDLGAALLGRDRSHDGPPHEEVAWTLGVEPWRALRARPLDARPARTAFPNGGLYVLRGGGAHLVARWGGVGQNGNGGHAHNDLSSYELSFGTPVVVDSGTYVYTADVRARNAFRAARAHNVLVVDGLDMHPLSEAQPFRLPAHARFAVEEWSERFDGATLVGWHDGFRRAGGSIRCRRRIALAGDSGIVEIADEVLGAGTHRAESLVHLAAGCRATRVGRSTVRVDDVGHVVTIEFFGATDVEVEAGAVSSQYGVREPADVVCASTSAELPLTIGYRITPA
jgi:uncharacterized heparinase superfamily protein